MPGTEKTIWGFSGAALLLVDEAVRVDNALYVAVRAMLLVSGVDDALHTLWQGGVLRVVVERSLWERYAVSTM